MKLKIQAVLAILALTLTMGSNAFALGSGSFSNEVLSARTAGEAFTGIAGVNDDLSSLYSNPGALTAIEGTQVTLGGTWENLHGDFQSNTGNDSKMRSIDVGVPNAAITQNLMDGKLAYGVGAFSPYGLETHWSDTGPLRYDATNTRLHMVDISPSVAYKVHPMVSVGAGADYVNAFDVALEKNVNMNDLNNGLALANGQKPVFAGLADGDSNLKGNTANWGFHAGLTFQPNKQNSFGLAYHSKVILPVNGSINLTGISGPYAQGVFGGSTFSTSANTSLILPQNIQFGYAFKPTDKWTLEADAAWYDWYSAQNIDVNYPTATPLQKAVLTTGNPQPLNFADAWSFAGGTNYKATDRLQVRGGFWYEPSVQPESAFTPGIMDLSRYGLATGIGYLITPAFRIDLAYNAIFTHSRYINNSLNQATGGDTSGSYSNFINLVALNFTYKFGGHTIE